MIRSTLALLALAWSLPLSSFAADPVELRVMSYNIRFGTAKDGENDWEHRKEFLIETIRAYNPDLLGTQETLGFQRDYLAEKLKKYDVLGVGRDDGKERGEMMALYYDRDRFEKLAGGHFWLSETPDVVGSKSWDAALPRMATWVRLKDKRQPQLPPIAFFNTHFDHKGPLARLESARLLRKQVLALGEGCSIVITGDFNTPEGSPPYVALFSDVDSHMSPVIDTFRTIHTARGDQEGTFSGFKASEMKGARIDWIAASRDWTVAQADIDRTSRNGRTPSDHFAVTAILRR